LKKSIKIYENYYKSTVEWLAWLAAWRTSVAARKIHENLQKNPTESTKILPESYQNPIRILPESYQNPTRIILKSNKILGGPG
jgi:hypothetical protein